MAAASVCVNFLLTMDYGDYGLPGRNNNKKYIGRSQFDAHSAVACVVPSCAAHFEKSMLLFLFDLCVRSASTVSTSLGSLGVEHSLCSLSIPLPRSLCRLLSCTDFKAGPDYAASFLQCKLRNLRSIRLHSSLPSAVITAGHRRINGPGLFEITCDPEKNYERCACHLRIRWDNCGSHKNILRPFY